MNHDTFSDLVRKSQAGDEKALIQLLLDAYTPVSYLTKKILQNERTAAQVTQEVLEILSGKLDSLTDASAFESWMCRITAARCMQAMPLLHRGTARSVVPRQWQDTLSDDEILTEDRSADVIQQLVDSLPENQRLCIMLISCGGLSVSAIAQITGFSASSVKEYIVKGQNAVQEQLFVLQNRGIQFSGVSSLTGILHTAMFRKAEEEEAIPVVYGVLGKDIPVPPNPGKWIARILGVILAALVVVFVALAGILIMKLK